MSGSLSDYSKLYETVSGNSPEHILASMFRDTCRELNLIPLMGMLVEERLRDMKSLSEKNRTIGPIRAEIISERMSWGLYVKLMTAVLKVDEITFTVSSRKDEVKSTITLSPKYDARKEIERKRRKDEKTKNK